MEHRSLARDTAAVRAWVERWDAVHAIEVREWRAATVAERFAELERLTRTAHEWARRHPHVPIDTEEDAVWARWPKIRRQHARFLARRPRPGTRRPPRVA